MNIFCLPYANVTSWVTATASANIEYSDRIGIFEIGIFEIGFTDTKFLVSSVAKGIHGDEATVMLLL